MLQAITKYWWVFLVRGIFAFLFGLSAFMWPGLTIALLIIMFGAYSLADGTVGIVRAFGCRGSDDRWWLVLIQGLAGVGVGLITFFYPGVTAMVLLIFIAAWAITTGIVEIVAAIRLRTEIEGEWVLALGGVLSVIFGVLLLARPGTGAMAMIWVIGAYAIAFSFILVVLAFKLKKVGGKIGNLAEASA